MAENPKDTNRRLEQEKQILKTLKQQIRSVSDINSVLNDIGDAYEEIKRDNEEILRLEKEGTQEALEKAEKLKKQVLLRQEENKLLAKQFTTLKGISTITSGIAGPILSTMLDKFWEQDKAIRAAATSMGMSLKHTMKMRETMRGVAIDTLKYGVGMEDLARGQQLYSEATGTVARLSEEAMINMSKVAKATGQSYDEMAGLTAEMKQFGFGANDSANLVWDMSQTAENMGVNSSKVIAKVKGSLGMMNKLNFNNGVKGMMKMAAFSEKYKISMESVAAVAEKVFRPEGAVEAAANLQVLGGSLSKLGNPFELMYKARNAPEELAESLTKAAAASAVWNEKTGEFKVSSLELDRLKEAGAALGMSQEELVKTAKQTAQIQFFKKGLVGKGLDKDEMEVISSMAEMRNGKASVTVGFQDGKAITKELNQLTKTELKELIDKRKSSEEAAMNAQTAKEKWENTFNQLLNASMPLLDTINNLLEDPEIMGPDGAINNLATAITEFIKGDTVKSFLKWLPAFGVSAMALSKGFELFSFATKTIGFFKTLFGKGFKYTTEFAKGEAQADGFTTKMKTQSSVTDSLKGKGGKGGGLPTTQNPTGGQAGGGGFMDSLSKIKPTQLLALGAAMIMVAGAIWIISDAMIRLKEASVGLEQFGMVIGIMVIGIGLLGIAALILEPIILPLLGVAAAFLMLGGGVWLATQGMSSLLEVLSMDKITPLFSLGQAMTLLSVGIITLGASIGVLGGILMSPFGMAGLLGLVGIGYALSKVDFTGIAKGVGDISTALSSMETGKLDELKTAAQWLALASMGDITVEFGDLNVKGKIDLQGQGGATADMDLLNDTIFISKLREKIFEGGKYTSMS
jgi:hypothetical protein